MDDSVFYRDGLGNPVALWSLRVARQRIYDLFVKTMTPTAATTIVDVGVSDEENAASNFLEKLHPFQRMITCAGLGNGVAVRAAFPGINFVHLEPGQRLPFADKAFDIAYSNAVMEHVGDGEARRRFIKETLRVGRRAFIAVPNRWFPIEHHTSLPLLHYSGGLFRRALRGTRFDYWTHPQNLEFLSKGLLQSECAEFPPSAIVATGLPLGPFSSNLALIWN